MMHIQLLVRTLVITGFVAASLAAGAAQIVVGQVAPLSGLEGTQARAYSTGIQLALTKANKAGGYVPLSSLKAWGVTQPTQDLGCPL